MGWLRCMLQGHKNSGISIDLSPLGGLLATGSEDGQARICKLSYGALLLLSFASQGATTIRHFENV
jgi:WD40 repeat protein